MQLTDVQPKDRKVLASALRQTLLRLAQAEDNCAANAAAVVPYWTACPPSVLGHRLAADVLRAEADATLR